MVLKRVWSLILIVILATFLTVANLSQAQDPPEVHDSHHPPSDVKTPTTGISGMGDMMKQTEGSAKEKEFYPLLMNMPELSHKSYLDLEVMARTRMKLGVSAMNQAFIDLITAHDSDDFPSMKSATANLREGIGQFESGIATHEALAERKSPQAIALTWFKTNLSLEDKGPFNRNRKTLFGLTLFHIFIMALLVLFFIAMSAMYFFKMRRATKLLAWLGNKANHIPEAKSVLKPKDTPSGKNDVKPLWQGKLKVATITAETPTVKTFKLISPDGGELPFTYLAGQFMTLSVVIDGKPIKRAYTISSHPCDKKMLEITIKREDNGLVSQYMHDVVHEGDLLGIEAASGKLTFSGVGEEGIVLIGGGVGITPLMSVLRCLISCGMKNEIHLLYACKSLEEIIYREELRQLQARNPNFKLVVAVEKLNGVFPNAFEGRFNKEKILEAVPKISDLRVHLCGPPPMMKAIRETLIELKVPLAQIKEEAFGPAKNTAPKAIEEKTKTDASSAIDSPALKKVTFKKAAKTVDIAADETVLELSESSGVEIPFQCRVGTCGVCKVQLLSGEVLMDVQDALTEDEKASKIILACQAKAKSDLEIDEP